jgi:hypothetical protein
MRVLGGCRRGVLCLPGWHLQDGDRVQRVRQHDQGLYGVHCWDLFEHALADKRVRRVWGWHVLECWGDGLHRLPQRDVLDREPVGVHGLRSRVLCAGQFERVRGLPAQHVPQCGWQGLGLGLPGVSGWHCHENGRQLGPVVLGVQCWHLRAERELHWVWCWQVLAQGPGEL